MKKTLTLTLTLTLTSALLMGSFNLQAASLDDSQKQEVKDLVRKTLVENPDILIEAMNELRKKEVAVQQQSDQQILSARSQALFGNSDNPVIGNPNAKLTIAYFTDYNCQYCKRQDPILRKITEENPNVKFVIKETPILGPASTEATQYSLATFNQQKDKYTTIGHRLMSKPGKHNSNSIKAAFKAEGIDVKKLEINAAVAKQINDNLKLFQELGLRGTPAIVFPDEMLRGYTDESVLREMIKERT